MKVFAVALALSLALSAAPIYAQAPAAAGAAQAPAPTAKPQQPPPAAQPQAPPRVPFQTGLKYAYVNLQVVATESVQGKAFNAKVKALQDQRVKELQDKNKAMQSNQDKLDKGATVLNEQARAQLQSEIEKQQREIQRATEDAQQELQVLTQQLQMEFEKLVLPALDQVAREKQVHFVFDAAQSGLVWADPSMDLTADVVKALDASGTVKPAAATAKPAAAPAAAPAATQKPAPTQK
jgi:outer membrane protein